MKKNEKYTGFEQGPIRPPSEASSLLIRIRGIALGIAVLSVRYIKGRRLVGDL